MRWLNDLSTSQMKALVEATAAERRRVRQLLKEGRPEQAEQDPVRRRAFSVKSGVSMGMPESVSGTNDFQPVSFLVDGATARRCVCRVQIELDGATESATAFLISPSLIMTNQHVIRSVDHARAAELVFDDEINGAGQPVAPTVFVLDPDRLAVFSPEAELDYAVVAVGHRVQGAGALADFGYVPLSDAKDKHRKGMAVNIIQHPRGRKKTIAIRNNFLLDRRDQYLIYDTDTLPGTSGSPAFNDDWEVIALHHYGQGDNEEDAAGTRQAVVNVGIRISAIYTDLKQRTETLAAGPQKDLLVDALSRYAAARPATRQQLERRPPPSAAVVPVRTGGQAESMRLARGTSAPVLSADGGASLVVPLQISIRLADTAAPAPAPPATPVLAPTPALRLSGQPERARLDRDYANRSGFDGGFIKGLDIDLGQLVRGIQARTLPLLDGTTPGLLHYQNFSAIVHAARRLALFTATNIDGPTYIELKRSPAPREPEREAWYRDPRVDPAGVIDDTFYAAWSALFDRGHLTRRADATWGDFAARAETDTFHFPNCTPQHFLFNQGDNLWQGIEQYVLERGVRTIEGARLSVLQGPVFNDETDLWADDVQIPSAYWKLVAWHGASGLKAVALLADQRDVLDINRGDAHPAKGVDAGIRKFVVPVPQLETMTGLDLSAFRAIDTAGGQVPTPGERFREVRDLDDIPLR
ncbi:DNA/RNA non-specific endonuclease [Cupriavidus sp. H18C2]|uniref:DNA/RNA non-specific endonuclease n=1 Tax=Cupriavidus sp. H18C2 TaxID=3241602 RepID=UPI003BF91C48